MDDIPNDTRTSTPTRTVQTPFNFSLNLGASTPQDGSSRSSTPTFSDISSSSRREFCIPHTWKPSIMTAINEKTLNCEVRNEIVRDLVTHVYSYIEKPTSAFVESVAKKLVDKYSFMGDFGNIPHVSSSYTGT